MKCDSGDDEVPGYYSGGDVEVDNGRLRIEVEQLRAEVERLRGALRSVRDDYDCDGVGVGGLECRHCLARAALGEP